MLFSDTDSVSSVRNSPELAEVQEHIMYWHGCTNEQLESMTFGQLRQCGWNIDGAVRGLERLSEITAQGKCRYNIYTDEEIAQNPEISETSVIYFPNTASKVTGKKPFVLVCAGGAFGMVCNFTEGFPVAEWFNRRGYDVFCLSYRVCIPSIFPKPMDDLAAAVKFIRANREKFGVSDDYIVCGFSAGGEMTCLWGTAEQGYAKYGLPKPLAMFPVYPLVNAEIYEPLEALQSVFVNMVGSEDTKKKMEKYDVLKLMDANYPPCYIVCGKNDSTVSAENSEKLYEYMQKFGIPAVLDETDNAEHGFGDGTGTTAEGWIDRAVEFFENL